MGGFLKTNVYIDGFNLYYGCLRKSPHRWLDLARICQALLPQNTINRIRYFTALVEARPGHPQQRQKQLTYLRALRTIPNLSIHYGRFLSSEVMMPYAHPTTATRTVKVIKTEEKGSDVHIATYLLLDGFRGDYEVAVVISNDSDLIEPISIARKEFGLKVGVLNPHNNVSWALKKCSTFYKQVDKTLLSACQFPPTLTDANGTITKPSDW
jgi:NYN domain